MSDFDATNLAAEESPPALDPTGVAAEAEAPSGDQTDESEQEEGEEPEAGAETEEIEHDGQKYNVPKALKDSFLRQADYTQKTQGLAREREALATRATEIAQQAEVHAATLEQRVQLATVDGQLQQYAETDWAAYEREYGPSAVATAMAQWRQLEAARGTLQSDIATKEQEHRLSSERVTATALQEAEKVLAAEVPGYGHELLQNVAKVAHSVGFSAQELRDSFVGPDGRADIRSFKVLARLHAAETELAALKGKETTAQRVEKQQAIQPAKTVTAKTNGYKPGLNDDLPIEEWVRRRNAEAAKHGRR